MKSVRLGKFIEEHCEKNKKGEDIPVFSVTNTNGFCTEYFSKDVSSKDKSNYKIVHKGFFAYNPSRINVGSVDWLRNEEKVIVSPLYNVFSVSPELEKQYLYYFLKSERGKTLIKSKAEGSVRDNLKFSILADFPIPLPSIEEQQKFVAKLDKASELILKYKRLLEYYDSLIKSRFIEMFGDPQCISNNWEVKSLSDYCVVNPKKSEIGSLPEDFELSFVPMQSVSENGDINTSTVKQYKDVKTGFTYFRENDVLFAKITPCMENGKGCVARNLKNKIGFGSTEFHVLRPIENISNSEWIYRLTTFKSFRKDAENNMTGSAGQRRTPKEFFDKYKVGLPPLSLQNYFAAFVQQIDKSKFEIEKIVKMVYN